MHHDVDALGTTFSDGAIWPRNTQRDWKAFAVESQALLHAWWRSPSSCRSTGSSWVAPMLQ